VAAAGAAHGDQQRTHDKRVRQSTVTAWRLTTPEVSRHLAVLTKAGLVTSERRGRCTNSIWPREPASAPPPPSTGYGEHGAPPTARPVYTAGSVVANAAHHGAG